MLLRLEMMRLLLMLLWWLRMVMLRLVMMRLRTIWLAELGGVRLVNLAAMTRHSGSGWYLPGRVR